MNLSPSTLLLIIVVTAVANILVLLAASARSRTNRARHLVEINGVLSSSYLETGPGEAAPESDDGRSASEGWPGSGTRWLSAGAGWPEAGFGASIPRATNAAEPAGIEPFEYPAPTSLEQRSLHDDDADDDPGDDAGDDPGDDPEWADDDSEEAVMQPADQVETPAVDEVAPDEVAPDDVIDDQADRVVRAIPTSATISSPRGRDPLTGMLDPLAFEEALIHEDAREQRYRRSATVIVFELDGLAKIVDRLGWDPGDRIEAALGDTITRLARRADYVARLERGRYAVLLPETDEVAAINYVERIRRACDLWLESGAIAMRLAIGWASTGGDTTLDGALRTATDRMRLELRRNSRLVGDESDVPPLEEASGL
jgi:diguanylate cyclase (GGDEF)-like protein